MKTRLSRKLIGVNIAIVVIALVVLTVVTSTLVMNYVRNDIIRRLETENTIAAKVYFGSIRNNRNKETGLEIGARRTYKSMAESTNVIYTRNELTGRYRIVFSSDETLKSSEKMTGLLDGITEAQEGEILEFALGGEKYIAKVNSFRENPDKEHIAIVTLSFIPASEMRELGARILFGIILSGFIIAVIAVATISLYSRGLTKPLGKLNAVAKRYASRQFDEKADVRTGDEIGELAASINEMGKSLAAYDQSQHKFFRNVSHELKTPLTAIQGYAEGLQNGIFEDGDATLDIIIEESKRIKELVNNLVYLDKLESGMEPYEFGMYSINETIVSAVRKVESIAILSDVEIAFEPGEDMKLRMDEEKMTRALINILSNCIKYAKDTVWIKAGREKNTFVFECVDNGDGFEEHVLDNLFNKAMASTKEGSGLGLGIAREIVCKHGGMLSAGNHETLGAQFRIQLPIGKQE